ncbi:nucleolar protein 14 [Moniliophthora roreri MCA 2997]|uniref:Nucleolar protein 14 n=1 Tax=Moniliophthora roreri (strain MCA 2997) TaxID=1381753 RepID=V2XA57_MONRO|nr:nucleolar protein 14 [Moniliophthora roreri MCA 2997]
MAKGSQLAQLKSALSQAGVVGNNHSKKRKRAAPTEKDKEKRAAKLDEIQRKLNPFDTKVTKLKHDVGGRKLKGVTGKPAKSKMAGIEQRKKTLLKEVEERGRAGGIVDRRFGENDPTMSLEERMLERFTREQQRASKGSAFNLEDEDELTHYGQSLANIDDFDNTGFGLDDDDEDDEGQIEKEIVKHTHFGGFDDDEEVDSNSEEPARKKSKAEVMAEVIAKSKEHKMMRQMEKEHGENVRHELDQAFDSLRDLLYAPDPSATGSNSIPLGVPETSGAAAEPKKDYDQNVRELAFESRAKPKDRTKTEEELALEEKEALEKAERKRKKRMLGLDDGDSEDEGKGRAKRQRGGDDLEDDFDDEEIDYAGLGAGLGEVDEDVLSENEDQETEDGDEDEADKDDEEEFTGIGGDDSSSEPEEEFEDDEHLVQGSKKASPTSKSRQTAQELPFTFPCPSSHDKFLEIVENVKDDDVPTVVKRIRTLHHASFAPENKIKLQKLNSVLVDHILYLASPPQPKFQVINALLPHLFGLTKAYPIQSAEQFNQKLLIMHRNLKRGLSRGASNPDSKTWPGLPELTLLRIVGAVWPTSDMNHAVISPTRILMGSYLGLGRVRTLEDIASGLFLCTLFLQFEQLSRRFVPEAINFLVNAVLHLAPSKYQESSELPGSFPAPDFRSAVCESLMISPKNAKGLEIQKPNLSAILSSSEHDESDKLNLFVLTLDALGKFADLYKGLEAFIEIFKPLLEICQNLEIGKLGKDVQTKLSSVTDMMTRLLKFAHQSRRPLTLQEHKPIPIPSYIPRLESTSSSYLRAQDPDHERNESNKLRAQYKKERKGAIRELRKDARFLAGVEQAKQKEKDRSYNERMKRVFGSIESERAEQKSMEREKTKEKRRAGRK